jgi:uroporphyrinogen-III synthase
LALNETRRTRKARPRQPPRARPRVAWITRAEPGAAATAARVRQLGIEPIVEPLLEVRAIEGADLDLSGVSALAFTSANAVAAFATRSTERTLRVFAVGDATAAAARAQRFQSVLSAQGDVAALASALVARRRELTGTILYPAAAEPAQDLAGALAAVGLRVRQTAIYETVAVQPSAAFVARLPEVDAVLLHSAKAAQGLAQFLNANPAPHLVAYCLSRQIGRSLTRAGLAAVLSAGQPNETALLGLLATA